MHIWSRNVAPSALFLSVSSLFVLVGTARAQDIDMSGDEVGGPPPAEVVIPSSDGGDASGSAEERSGPTSAYIFAVTADESLQPIVRELDSALRDVLAGERRYRMNDADAQLNGLDFDASEALQQARDLFESGRAAYDNLELDAALEQFSQALQAFEEQIGHVTEINEISNCLIYAGAAEVLNGQTRQARAFFQRLLIFDPERRPDPDVFPPPVIEAFDSAAARLERVREGQLTVTTYPEGADVFVDGIYQGPSPQELSGFKAGNHYVRVRLQGYTETGRIAEVSSRRPTSVEVSLDPTEEGPQVAGLLEQIADEVSAGSDEVGQTVQQLGQMLNLGVVFTAVVGRGNEGVVVIIDGWNVEEGRSVARERAGPFEDDPMVIAGDIQPSAGELIAETWNVMNVRQVETEPIVEPPPETPPPPPPSRPVWQRWWFWTAVGAVVVGAGVGIGVGVAASNEEPGRTDGEVILDL